MEADGFWVLSGKLSPASTPKAKSPASNGSWLPCGSSSLAQEVKFGAMPYPWGNVTGLKFIVEQAGPLHGLSHTQTPAAFFSPFLKGGWFCAKKKTKRKIEGEKKGKKSHRCEQWACNR